MNIVGYCKIDKEDLDKVKSVGRWTLDADGYVLNGNPRVAMHRLIMNASDNQQVDHRKVGLKYRSDNRKKNLRMCSHSQNLCNTKINKRNKSGHKGVHWSNSRQSWIVSISFNNKRKHLGQYTDFDKACKMYQKASREIHKEFASKELSNV